MRFCGMCGTRLSLTCPACNFENPAFFRFCGNCGTTLNESALLIELTAPSTAPTEAAGAALPLPTGERRIATVVVTDLTGSTVLLEKVGTEVWVELMNRVLHILETEITRFGGWVEQFRGDGLVAFFGATVAHEDDPERAVLAALAMQDALGAFTPEVSQHYSINLKLRVGVNTGEVIVAAPGERRPHSEIAMGIAISVADRMEGAASPGTVLVSDDTYRLVETKFEWQSLGEINVQGIAHPIAVHRPLSIKATTEDDPQQLAHELQPDLPLIGRDDEFLTLRRCVEDVLSGRGRIVLLTGEKGLGKSFLINQLREYFAHRDALMTEAKTEAKNAAEIEGVHVTPITWLRGRCRSYHQGWPFSMWVDALQGWLGAAECDSKEELRDELRGQTQTLWGEGFAEHYPYLASLLSLPLEEEFSGRMRHLTSEDLRQRYFLALRNWAEAMSKRGPLAFIFADMQWADSTSLEALQYCLPLSDTEALLYVLVGRVEREAPMQAFSQYLAAEYPHRLTSINLLPLSQEQSAQLIKALLGDKALSEYARDLILQNAEGNPYFLQEMIRSLVAGGVLIRDGSTDKWRMTRAISSLDLPGSLQQLLQARIDQLSTEERFVLQVAAVIGSVFWANVVAALAGALVGSGRAVQVQLIALQRAQLIRETGRVPELGMQYLFVSPLLREATYESLLTAQRVGFHARIAEYLERHISASALVGYHGLLAYHYSGAQDPHKELFYTLLAADEARNVYANAEALSRYTRALSLLEQLQAKTTNDTQRRAIQTQEFEVLRGRCAVRLALGEMTSAGEDAQALLQLASQMSDEPAWQVDALLMHIEVHSASDTRERVTQNLEQAYQALRLAQQMNDRHREMQSWMAVSQARFYLRLPESEQAAERALELARQLEDRQAEVSILVSISEAYGIDNLSRSEAYVQEALARAEHLDDKGTRISLLGALSQQFERRGDYYHQLVQYEQPRLNLAREIGHRHIEARALNACGQIQGLYLGDYATGLSLMEEALRKSEPATGRVFLLLRIAQIQAVKGNLAEAQAVLEQARPYTAHTLNNVGWVGLTLVSAIVETAMGIAKSDEASLRAAVANTWQAQQMVTDNLVSRQYRMAAACHAATAHMQLAYLLALDADKPNPDAARAAEREQHLRWALDSSQAALTTYTEFGFTQVVECTSEEILFRHSQALAVNVRDAEAIVYLRRAYDEMMRKHDLIPADSGFRQSYLDIALHGEILEASALPTQMS